MPRQPTAAWSFECHDYDHHGISTEMNRAEYYRAYDAKRKEARKAYDAGRKRSGKGKGKRKHVPKSDRIIGIDGEGLTLDSGAHIYSYMAAWDSEREVGSIDAGGKRQLKTVECLDFLLGLPANALIFGFSLGYDYSKMLEDLPDRILYELPRPELRLGGKVARDWNGYRLNMMQGQFRVSRIVRGMHKPGCRPAHYRNCRRVHCRGCRIEPCTGCVTKGTRTVWDIYKFFQSSFLQACAPIDLNGWDVLSRSEYEYIKSMKERRQGFSRAEWAEIKKYCGLECQRLAELGRRLVDAHAEAGLILRAYYGAGSTGGAMLESMNAKSYMSTRVNSGKYKPLEYEPPLKEAIAAGFFGGRFELSRVGPIEQKVWSWDIASAYPYQFTFLPCLVHGRWEHVAGRKVRAAIERATTAIVRYRLPDSRAVPVDRKRKRPFYMADLAEHAISPVAWGPYPFRTSDGNIVWPVTSGGGWVWKSEFMAGERFSPNVQVLEAWVYNTDCSCDVFRNKMPAYYCQRLEWGKEGRGIVVKLGTNSCYGKAAQSKGESRPYQSWVWAGMVTAGCRAQLLDAIAVASDRESVIATATDSIMATAELELGEPVDTGTRDAAARAGKQPLGAWERCKQPFDGMMLIRPGVLFPLEAGKTDVKLMKARGIGKQQLLNERERVIEQYRKDGPLPFTIRREIFWGMKSSVRLTQAGIVRDPKYGTWSADQPVCVSYGATPKRPIAVDGKLWTWAFDQQMQSEAYQPALDKKSVLAPHIEGIITESNMLWDQPDQDDMPDEREL